MKTINIHTDASVSDVPVLIPFQAAPLDVFFDGEEVYIQLVNDHGIKVGTPQIRSVIKTLSAEEGQSSWYEVYTCYVTLP